MAQVGLLEDNARIAKLCATMLHYAGHQVTIYQNPLACLQALLPARTKDDTVLPIPSLTMHTLPIDVLVLDLYLPHISGLEVLHYLHSYSHTRYMPLVLCTAASHKEITQARSFVPHAELVEKPFKLEVLADAITKALNARVQ